MLLAPQRHKQRSGIDHVACAIEKGFRKSESLFKIYGILTIIRASKTTLLRSATLFANTFAFGKRVNFLPFIMCVP